MSRKFPFMKSIEDVSKIDNLNGSHSTSLNQYKVSTTDFLDWLSVFMGLIWSLKVYDLGKSCDPYLGYAIVAMKYTIIKNIDNLTVSQ